MPSLLPPELVDQIIDILGTKYNQTYTYNAEYCALLSCVLVSHSVRHRALAHLLCTLQFGQVTPRRTMENPEMIGMVIANPDLAPYVKRLTVNLNPDLDLLPQMTRAGAVMDRLAAPNSGLHTFGLNSRGGPFFWEKASSTFNTAITNLCRSGHVKTLSIFLIEGFSLSNILDCVNMRSLNLAETRLTKVPGRRSPTEDSKSVSVLSNLETLLLHYAASSFIGAVAGSRLTLDIRQLRDLTSDLCLPSMLPDLFDVLPGLRESLTTLNLSCDTEECYGTAENPLDLGMLQNLTTVGLSVTTDTYQEGFSGKNLFWMFRLSTASSSIQKISIAFFCQVHEKGHMNRHFTGGEWKFLDECLSDPLYQALGEVALTFHVQWWWQGVQNLRDLRDLIFQKISDGMPLLTRSQKFKLDSIITGD